MSWVFVCLSNNHYQIFYFSCNFRREVVCFVVYFSIVILLSFIFMFSSYFVFWHTVTKQKKLNLINFHLLTSLPIMLISISLYDEFSLQFLLEHKKHKKNIISNIVLLIHTKIYIPSNITSIHCFFISFISKDNPKILLYVTYFLYVLFRFPYGKHFILHLYCSNIQSTFKITFIHNYRCVFVQFQYTIAHAISQHTKKLGSSNFYNGKSFCVSKLNVVSSYLCTLFF